MFRSKTVFIIGAGASCEAGLPSGHDLKHQIAAAVDIRFPDGYEQRSGDRQIMQALRRHVQMPEGRQGDPNPYLHAGWRIRDAMPQAISIDNFIDAHRGDAQVELVGKLGIAKTILSAEAGSKLRYASDHEDKVDVSALANTWYVRLAQLLHEDVPLSEIDAIFDNVAVITFNYDRCIEHFLLHSLVNYYGISIERSAEVVGRLRIYHPYGRVGRLPWQPGRDTKVRFGDAQRADILEVATQLRTFTERTHDATALAAIRSLIAEAQTVVFLGFAFHRQNLALITPDGNTCVRNVFATTLGISAGDLNIVTELLESALQPPSGAIKLNMLPDTCAALLGSFRLGLTQ